MRIVLINFLQMLFVSMNQKMSFLSSWIKSKTTFLKKKSIAKKTKQNQNAQILNLLQKTNLVFLLSEPY